MGHELKEQNLNPIFKNDNIKLWNDNHLASVRKSEWYANICTSDYVNVATSTPTDGTITCLHHKGFGAILAATMTDYSLPEPFNMQFPLQRSITCQSRRLQRKSDSSLFSINATLSLISNRKNKTSSQGFFTIIMIINSVIELQKMNFLSTFPLLPIITGIVNDCCVIRRKIYC